jgi:hypothetical protein
MFWSSKSKTGSFGPQLCQFAEARSPMHQVHYLDGTGDFEVTFDFSLSFLLFPSDHPASSLL